MINIVKIYPLNFTAGLYQKNSKLKPDTINYYCTILLYWRSLKKSFKYMGREILLTQRIAQFNGFIFGDIIKILTN